MGGGPFRPCLEVGRGRSVLQGAMVIRPPMVRGAKGETGPEAVYTGALYRERQGG